MRVAAVLAVLGHHLAEEILQPLYILEEGGELNELLSELASDDPPREAFLRSTLLVALTRKDQWENRQKRLKDVFRAVVSAVQPLVPDGKQDSFRRALRDLCARHCETWSEIQRLEDKVEWSLDTDVSENLELLELPLLTDGQSSRAVPQVPQLSDNTASQPRGAIESIVAPVWPCFFFVRREGGELIGKGFALGEEQIKVAKSEVSSLRRSLTGSHREARLRARTFSNQGESKAANSFLSPNGSAELAGS